MSQATGGAINMFLVAIFLAVVSGYLAFSVSYNKAFRYKNQIIDSIEQCEGITNSKTDSNTVCVIEKVRAYAKTIGYNNEEINKDGYTCFAPKYKCYNSKEEIVNKVLDNLKYDVEQAKYDLEHAQDALEIAQEELEVFKQKYEI